ncbi:MAG: hypothetical protein HKP58_02980 [Desulfatitalea sp.]|nr:hypothetical protein [Desulfatitalea sp.]NNJ99355.1 hypothetical protein [Desulfatitalea sp.]
MRPSSIPAGQGRAWSAWLTMTHLLLCLSVLPLHLARYPLTQSLYYWWVAPFDAVALLAATPLYLSAALAAWGFGLTLLVSATEAVALTYLGLLSITWPMTWQSPSVADLCSALTVAARIPVGWCLVAVLRPPAERIRGCLP